VLAAAGERVRLNAEAAHSHTYWASIIDPHFLLRHLLISLIAGLALWGGLSLLRAFFHKLRWQKLEPVAIVVGVFLAGFLPPHLFDGLCRGPYSKELRPDCPTNSAT